MVRHTGPRESQLQIHLHACVWLFLKVYFSFKPQTIWKFKPYYWNTRAGSSATDWFCLCFSASTEEHVTAAGQVLRCPQGEHTEGRRSGSHMFITSLWRVNQSQWVQSRTYLPQIEWRLVNSDGERRKLTKWLYCHETTSWQEASADLWPLLPAGEDITCPTRVCPQIKTKY